MNKLGQQLSASPNMARRPFALALLVCALVCACSTGLARAESAELLKTAQDGADTANVNEEVAPAALVPVSLSNELNTNNNYAPFRSSAARERLLAAPKILVRHFLPNLRMRSPMYEPIQLVSLAAETKRSSPYIDNINGLAMPGKRSWPSLADSSSASLVNYRPLLSRYSSIYESPRARLFGMQRLADGPFARDLYQMYADDS